MEHGGICQGRPRTRSLSHGLARLRQADPLGKRLQSPKPPAPSPTLTQSKLEAGPVRTLPAAWACGAPWEPAGSLPLSSSYSTQMPGRASVVVVSAAWPAQCRQERGRGWGRPRVALRALRSPPHRGHGPCDVGGGGSLWESGGGFKGGPQARVPTPGRLGGGQLPPSPAPQKTKRNQEEKQRIQAPG